MFRVYVNYASSRCCLANVLEEAALNKAFDQITLSIITVYTE